MDDKELKNIDMHEKEMVSGSNPISLLGIVIFLIIVIVIGVVVRTGTL
jgi:hypothetical protein